MSDCA